MTTTKQLQAATQQFPTRIPILDGDVSRPTFHKELRRVDDSCLVMTLKQIRRRDFKATESPGEESLSLNKDPHNVWMNASGTKVTNQIGAQTMYSSQNFTL
jgi:hypothetical protein